MCDEPLSERDSALKMTSGWQTTPYPVSRVEVNRLKALLIEQLDDLPAGVCLAAMMELSLTFLRAAVPLAEQKAIRVEACIANMRESPDNVANGSAK